MRTRTSRSRPSLARARRRGAALFALAALVISATGPGVGANDRDIDNDGSDELLIGVPLEDLGRFRDAGVVHVAFGPSPAAPARFDGLLRQGGALTGAAGSGDAFGGSVELVDIDGDGYADAVIGSPGEAVGGVRGAGVVHIVPGGPEGLVRSAATRVVEGRRGMPGRVGVDNAFGWDLAAGDFDGDGYGDVAVSAVGEPAGGAAVAGAVTVMMGGPDGIRSDRSTQFSQAGPVRGRPDDGDSFGRSLAVGDFDGDGYDDLAVGVPGERVRRQADAGAVNVLYGSSSGLTTEGNQLLTQAVVRGRAEAGDLFGFSLAATDLDCDGRDELAIGAPNEDFGRTPNTGVVQVVSGGPDGLVLRPSVSLGAGRKGVPGERANAGFGKALAGADVDGDECGDLVVGAPFATVQGRGGAGAAMVIAGGPRWSESFDARLLSAPQTLDRAPASGEFFASSFAVLDWNGDGHDDVAIGVPGATVAGQPDAGMLVIVEGSARGLRARDSTVLSQRSPVRNSPEAGDQFSSSLQDGLS